ncbi:MAG TPA: hypothetical protein VG826_11935 [Pirellulales bacterium]|nr:hypothetical protein [Pirellulales bacterium]
MFPFVTAYDPLGGSAGSIDPLGALQTYGLLADLLLPGVTTITTRSRYLSMVCAAIANAEKGQQVLPGPSGLAQRRKAIEPFERLWALACVAAGDAGHEGASDGLRGISYAERTYRDLRAKNRPASCDFPLLKYQSRTGAVGTYWTALVGGQLVERDSGSLSSEGQELAKRFPEPRVTARDKGRLADPSIAHRVSVPFDDLVMWGEECHLQAATDEEKQQLGEALTASDRRDCVSRALRMMKGAIPDEWNTEHLVTLGKKLVTLRQAVELGLPLVIDAIVVSEQFHEAVLAAFEILLWWGTQNASKPTADLFVDADFRSTFDRCRATAQRFRDFRDGCARRDVREATQGLATFCSRIDVCQSARELVIEIMDHHHRVQSGKLDGGVPKRDWITWHGRNILRPSPRFQRNNPPSPATGISLTHPYRLEPFVQMLRENGWLVSD